MLDCTIGRKRLLLLLKASNKKLQTVNRDICMKYTGLIKILKENSRNMVKISASSMEQ